MQSLLGPEERVAALYSRVMHRVCQRLLDAKHDVDGETRAEEEAARVRLEEAAARVEQRWRERLTCYTGYTYAPVAPAVEALGDSAGGDDERDGASTLQEPPPMEAAATDQDKADEEPGLADSGSLSSMGRPLALMQLATPSSIYAKMFNAKRKIDQLDGATEDDDEREQQENTESDLHDDGADESEPNTQGSTSMQSTASISSVSGEAAAPPLAVDHVAALSVTRFPLQCSAHDLNFTFKKGMLRGKWKNAVLTLLRRVNRFERIARGHVLWLTTLPDEMDAPNAAGCVVEVVEAPAPDGSLVVRVGRQGGLTLTALLADTRRFHEWIVADCNVHLKFLTS